MDECISNNLEFRKILAATITMILMWQRIIYKGRIIRVILFITTILNSD